MESERLAAKSKGLDVKKDKSHLQKLVMVCKSNRTYRLIAELLLKLLKISFLMNNILS